jgi:hypothetical protein
MIVMDIWQPDGENKVFDNNYSSIVEICHRGDFIRENMPGDLQHE